MPFAAVCPDCEAKAKVPDQLAGKKIKCPKCDAAFIARAPVKNEDDDRPAKAKSRRPVDEDEPGRPVKSKRPVDDDEDEAPRPKKKAVVDDDDDPKPKKKKKKKKKQGMPVGVLVGIIAGVLVLIGGGVGAAIYFSGDKSVAQGGTESEKNKSNASKPKRSPTPGKVLPPPIDLVAPADSSAWITRDINSVPYRIKVPTAQVRGGNRAPIYGETTFILGKAEQSGVSWSGNGVSLDSYQVRVPDSIKSLSEDDLLDRVFNDEIFRTISTGARTKITFQGYKGWEQIIQTSRGEVEIIRVILAKGWFITLEGSCDPKGTPHPETMAFFESLVIE